MPIDKYSFAATLFTVALFIMLMVYGNHEVHKFAMYSMFSAMLGQYFAQDRSNASHVAAVIFMFIAIGLAAVAVYVFSYGG